MILFAIKSCILIVFKEIHDEKVLGDYIVTDWANLPMDEVIDRAARLVWK